MSTHEALEGESSGIPIGHVVQEGSSRGVRQQSTDEKEEQEAVKEGTQAQKRRASKMALTEDWPRCIYVVSSTGHVW